MQFHFRFDKDCHTIIAYIDFFPFCKDRHHGFAIYLACR